MTTDMPTARVIHQPVGKGAQRVLRLRPAGAMMRRVISKHSTKVRRVSVDLTGGGADVFHARAFPTKEHARDLVIANPPPGVLQPGPNLNAIADAISARMDQQIMVGSGASPEDAIDMLAAKLGREFPSPNRTVRKTAEADVNG